MVYEEVLTILFAIAVGVSIIAYAARPRQRSVPASMAAPVVASSFAPAPVQSIPVQHVTVEAPAVIESAAPIDELDVPYATPAVADELGPVLSSATTIAPLPTTETTTATTTVVDVASTDVTAPATSATEGVVTEAAAAVPSLETPPVSPKPRRTTRRKSTTTTTTRRTRSRSPKNTDAEIQA